MHEKSAIKPIFKNNETLDSLGERYRRDLCENNPELCSRLVRGKMERVGFRELAKAYDLIWFDAFGVLNRGEEAIAGAKETLDYLRQQGCPFRVVTNNATLPAVEIKNRLLEMGFYLETHEIISSGMAIRTFVQQAGFQGKPFFWIGTVKSALVYAPQPFALIVNYHAKPSSVSAQFVLISSNNGYYGSYHQQLLEEALAQRPIPLLVANPDLVAPEGLGRMSLVAGYTAWELADRFGVERLGIGKPYPPIFKLALRQSPKVAKSRILMVGDSLDTDILGGAAMGVTTCLTLSGIYANTQLDPLCERKQIRPDFVVEDIGH